MGFHILGFALSAGVVVKEYCDRFYPISIVGNELILEVCQKEQKDGVLSIASDLAVTTVNYITAKMYL